VSTLVLSPEAGEHSLKETRWGGTRLARLYGGEAFAGRHIGEFWAFSTLPGHESRCAGRPLSSFLSGPLPFLAKLIDTDSALSVQVHPSDDASRGMSGKEEAWIVLGAESNAFVYVGLSPGCDSAKLRHCAEQAVSDPSKSDRLLECLDKVPVARGTCIVVPSGTIHAIGAGILLAEIQQPVDQTYRLFDYGSGRQLHVDEALSSAREDARALVWRPGEAMIPLAGAHVELRILAEGMCARPTHTPALLVPTSGVTVVREHTHEYVVPTGQLRLLLDAELDIEVQPRGLAVLGTVG